ncbi:hypothetical protein [Pseudomonas mucidolens]|uniref:Uncharacterized protein n=1 Tax=Pseudomonas mucidolens TaxID=46679 RepID=A0A1H2LR70_9PSED|nr:hypothetical protein [Pseudomonas mucidolens]SDU83071.1 hypothetical protein SAMN05216202_0227 [Pseudomonas mucidolens]SQH35808.1 Uncharacterised protein [Pseudomonas mucidolens]
MTISATSGAPLSSINTLQFRTPSSFSGPVAQFLMGVCNTRTPFIMQAGDRNHKPQSGSSSGFNSNMSKFGTAMKTAGEFGMHSANNKVKVAGAAMVGIGQGMSTYFGSKK